MDRPSKDASRMFRKLLNGLLRRWLLGLIAVAALGVLIWFVGPLVAIAEYRPLASQLVRFCAIAALLLLWGFDNLRVRDRERRAGDELTRGLVKPAPVARNGTSPQQ